MAFVERLQPLSEINHDLYLIEGAPFTLAEKKKLGTIEFNQVKQMQQEDLQQADQTIIEFPNSEEKQPFQLVETKIIDSTNQLLSDAREQKNPYLIGACSNALRDNERNVEPLDQQQIEKLKEAVVLQLHPTDVLGNSIRGISLYANEQMKLSAIVNLRQNTFIEAQLTPEQKKEWFDQQFSSLNRELYSANRSADLGSLTLEDIRFATNLKLAFPEKVDEIDVYDVQYSDNVTRPGLAKMRALQLFKRSAQQNLFAPQFNEQEQIRPAQINVSEQLIPAIQSGAWNEQKIHFNSNNLAAVTVGRFIHEFYQNEQLERGLLERVVSGAKEDLVKIVQNNEKVLSDPHYLSALVTHLGNIKILEQLLESDSPTGLQLLPNTQSA